MGLFEFLTLLAGLLFSAFLSVKCTRGFASSDARILVFILAVIPGVFASTFLALAASAESGLSLFALVLAALCWSPVVYFGRWRQKKARSNNEPPSRSITQPATATAPQALPEPVSAKPNDLAWPEIRHKPTSVAPPKPPTLGIALPCTFSFAYRDQTGAYASRTVKVTGISSNSVHTYLDGFCLDRRDSRTFRTDRIRGDLTDMDSGELVSIKRLLAEVRGRSSMTYRSEASSRSGTAQPNEWQTAVLFTGFPAARRDELEMLAYATGWDVRTTVGSTLDYLVTGPRAGSSKVSKAEELGVSVIDEAAFRSMIV